MEGGERQPTARYRLCRTITKFDPAGGGLLDFSQNSRCLLSLFGVFGSFLLKKVEEKGSVAECSFQTQTENLFIKKVSENHHFDGSY